MILEILASLNAYPLNFALQSATVPFICGSSLNLAFASTPLACTLTISPSFTFAAAANDAEPISPPHP